MTDFPRESADNERCELILDASHALGYSDEHPVDAETGEEAATLERYLALHGAVETDWTDEGVTIAYKAGDQKLLFDGILALRAGQAPAVSSAHVEYFKLMVELDEDGNPVEDSPFRAG